VPPADYNGLTVTGSYGNALLIESYFIPVGWIAIVASGGPDSTDNPVGFREHVNPAYQGLRVIPGHWQDYPFIESYLARGLASVCDIAVRLWCLRSAAAPPTPHRSSQHKGHNGFRQSMVRPPHFPARLSFLGAQG